ncbi:S1C family serine protease [Seohaeicola saemankumensis]|nr:trypsin-like peptidase domain-containing protein [Seohaeicola saemankumensis]MCA0873771.1 S1C family serine protease [Seohaeicola saemankumensis]
MPVLADGLVRAMSATLVIYSDDDASGFLGSGFVYGPLGRYALTNAHVVGDADRVRVAYQGGHRETASVVARDDVRDIAVLALTRRGQGLTAATDAPVPGQQIFALGAPLGQGFTLTRGIVSAAPRQVEAQVPLRLIQHDAAINPGSSGGPLVDGQGRLIGMNSRIADGSRLFVGIGYAIAATDLDRLVPQMLDGRLRPVPVLGLDVRPLDARIAHALNVTVQGILVDDVSMGGRADQAGLRPGDIVLRAGGRALATPGDLAFAIEETSGAARFDLLRDGVALSVEVPVMPDPFTDTPRPATEPELMTLGDLGLQVDGTAMITVLDPGGAAARGGLARGDRILRLNGAALSVPVANADLAAIRVTGAVVLLVAREDRHLHVILDPGADKGRRRPVSVGNSLDLSVARF